MNRIGKQFIYGVLYLIVFGGLIYIGYFLLVKPAPTCTDRKQNQDETGVDCGGSCAACIGMPEPISVRLSTIFFAKDPVALVRLTNPNTQVGAENIGYSIEVLGVGDSVLDVFEGETFVYPGDQEKNLVFLLTGLEDARTLKVALGEPIWKRIEEFKKPDFSFVRSQKRITQDRIIIEGEIKNNETLLFDNIEIGALFFSQSGILVGASETAVQTVKAFERRAFTIEFPFGNLSVDPEATRLYYDARRP